jgi:hypothetical protein
MKKDKIPGSPNVTIADVVALIHRALDLRNGIMPREIEAIAISLHNAAIDCMGAIDPVGAARDRQRLAARLAKLPDDELAQRWRGPEFETFPFFCAEVLEAAWAAGLDTDLPLGEWLRTALGAVAESEPVAPPSAAMIAHAAAIGAVIEAKRPWHAEGRGRPSSDHAAALAEALADAYGLLTGRPATRWTGDGKHDPATMPAGSFKRFGSEFCRMFGVAIEVTRDLAGPMRRK